MAQAEQAGAFLASKGIRQTPQRVVVVEELANEANDATAMQLYDRLRKRGMNIGLATVYRTLTLLHEQGAVDTMAHHAGEICYRLCTDTHHHHLMCTGCHGWSSCTTATSTLVKRSAKQHGFTATSSGRDRRPLR
jgi:Fur family ferric uptake transcriptional regulator